MPVFSSGEYGCGRLSRRVEPQEEKIRAMPGGYHGLKIFVLIRAFLG